jgi:hypothetical protein
MATIKAQITLTDTTAAAIRSLDARGRLSEGIETLYRDYMRGSIPIKNKQDEPKEGAIEKRQRVAEEKRSNEKLTEQIYHYECVGQPIAFEEPHKDLTPAVIEAALAVFEKNKTAALLPGSDWQKQNAQHIRQDTPALVKPKPQTLDEFYATHPLSEDEDDDPDKYLNYDEDGNEI